MEKIYIVNSLTEAQKDAHDLQVRRDEEAAIDWAAKHIATGKVTTLKSLDGGDSSIARFLLEDDKFLASALNGENPAYKTNGVMEIAQAVSKVRKEITPTLRRRNPGKSILSLELDAVAALIGDDVGWACTAMRSNGNAYIDELKEKIRSDDSLRRQAMAAWEDKKHVNSSTSDEQITDDVYRFRRSVRGLNLDGNALTFNVKQVRERAADWAVKKVFEKDLVLTDWADRDVLSSVSAVMHGENKSSTLLKSEILNTGNGLEEQVIGAYLKAGAPLETAETQKTLADVNMLVPKNDVNRKTWHDLLHAAQKLDAERHAVDVSSQVRPDISR